MNISDAIRSIIKPHTDDVLAPLSTVFSETMDREKPWQEYPRPQLVRDSYFSLNGLWDYAITKTDARPDTWDGKILVPFSPEAELSGVNRTLHPGEILWYRRTLSVPAITSVCLGAYRRLHGFFCRPHGLPASG